MQPIDWYRNLVLARAVDDVVCAVNQRWFPLTGEEAVVVGSFATLDRHDVAAPAYRDPFIVYLLRGAELWRLIAQAMGKAAGYNKGRSVPFSGPIEAGVVPWVAGDLGSSLGVATGAAVALQRRGEGVCVCTFGDGASNRGDFHENINLAAVWKLPIVFVCQNNQWAISQRASDYLPAPIVNRATGYGIPGIDVDGQDVELVAAVVAQAVARARSGAGPTLIEARTVRVKGHWAADATEYRGPEDRIRVADPIELLAERLVKRGEATEAELSEVKLAVAAEVETALDKARALPDPTMADLGLEDVYA